MNNKNKILISAVSYLNTLPFTHGIKNSKISESIELSLDIPSVCAEKVIQGKVDMGLIPIAGLLEMNAYHVISDYCIGAEGAVNSVILMSNVPLNEIKSIYLDYQSKTSVILCRILAAQFWKIDPEWISAQPGYENEIKDTTAGLIIGDRVFTNRKKFLYQYDLAEEWQKLTKLPFVFAVWASREKLPEDFISQFNDALSFGLSHKKEALKSWDKPLPDDFQALDYLENSISYNLSQQKMEAMKSYFLFAKELVPAIFA